MYKNYKNVDGKNLKIALVIYIMHTAVIQVFIGKIKCATKLLLQYKIDGVKGTRSLVLANGEF